MTIEFHRQLILINNQINYKHKYNFLNNFFHQQLKIIEIMKLIFNKKHVNI